MRAQFKIEIKCIAQKSKKDVALIKDTIGGGIYSVNAAALLLGVAGLLSRLLGIFRDRLLAAHFGAGRELDIYYAAFQIPDFMSILFLLGAGSAAILPIFQEYLGRDRQEARRIISELATNFIMGASAVCIFIAAFASFIVPYLVPGFSQEEQILTTTLARIMLFSPLLLGLSTIFSSVVESQQRFLTYALAPLLYNVGIIIGIVFLVPLAGLPGLALGVVIGAALHMGINFLTVRTLGFTPQILFRRISAGAKKVSLLAFPRVLSISLSQLTLMAMTLIGSTLQAGSIAVFQLAQNLYALPIGIFGVSYAVALFPQLSRAYIDKEPEAFFNKLFMGIRTILFWILPSIALFIVLRAHMVRVALGAGAFSWEDTRLTAASLAILSFAMFAGSLASILIKSFYSLENTWMPLFINMGASALSIGLAFFFADVFSQRSPFAVFVFSILRISDIPHPEVIGLVLGFSIGLFVNIYFLYQMLRRLAARIFGFCPPFPMLPIVKIVAASFLAAGASYGVRVSFSETLPLITFVQVLFQGFLAGVAGIVVYFGALIVFGEEDVQALWQTLRRRLIRVRALPESWDGESHIST